MRAAWGQMAIDAPEPIAARVGLAHLLVKNFGAYGAHALSRIWFHTICSYR